MTKYMNAFHETKGDSLAKVKSVVMHFADSWDWIGSESMVADLLDDQNITAEDTVDFLTSAYESEGGNDEFRYAVRALQVCLRKQELQSIKNQEIAEEEMDLAEDSDEEDFHFNAHHPHPHFINLAQHVHH
jgi:hypothetical protein